jgi:hypothetical protein
MVAEIPRVVRVQLRSWQLQSAPILCREEESAVGLDFDEVLIELFSEDLRDFDCPYCRPEPLLCPIFEEERELGFVGSALVPFLFDGSEVSIGSREEARGLLRRAALASLGNAEVDLVIGALDRFPSLVEERATDEQAFGLLRYNRAIAKAFFSRVAAVHPEACEFITRAGLVPEACDLVETLCASGRIPPAVIDEFVNRAMDAINGASDQGVKIQKAMLFCRFMTAVRPNEMRFAAALVVPLRAICVEMAGMGIPEARELLAMLETRAE